MAFLLVPHTAHRVTTKRTKSTWDSLSCIVKIQFFAFVSWFRHICSTNPSSAKDQTLWAIVQSINACLQESSAPYKTHVGEFDICLWCKRSTVGIECWARRYKNTFNFEGTFIFHRDVHALLSVVILDGPSISSSQFSLLSLVFKINR